MTTSDHSRPDVVVLMSGGIDSSALAKFCTENGYASRGMFIDYGQAAREHEWRSVKAVASQLAIPVQKLVCAGPRFGAGELVGRNQFLISAAIFLGEIHCGLVAIGVHSGTPYYDCSQLFIERVTAIVEEQSNGKVSLIAPFVDWRKAQIFSYFQKTGLLLETTYSCESGTVPPCGSCASCRDRGAL